MEAEFWHERWQNNLIGFHLDQVNPYLVQFWPSLPVVPPARVFVPLCGKSRDLYWLTQQGYEVVGVELSELAVQAFFTENNLTPQLTTVNGFKLYRAEGLSLYCGDFFQLSPMLLGEIAAVYDRASLIALPPAMRQDYAGQLQRLCPRAPTLLITLEYDQSLMGGPPFAVSEAEVRALYAEFYQIDRLLAQDVLEKNSRFRERGLNQLLEVVYRLSPPG